MMRQRPVPDSNGDDGATFMHRLAFIISLDPRRRLKVQRFGLQNGHSSSGQPEANGSIQ
jgi:hypothetical protein